MGQLFAGAVALYGSKERTFAALLSRIQGTLATRLGEAFRAYALPHVHATLIGFGEIQESAAGRMVNQYYWENRGEARVPDYTRLLADLRCSVTTPLVIRLGGHSAGEIPRFTSRGQTPYERSFSCQGSAFVLVGWPVAKEAEVEQPLAELRLAAADANVLHRYHRRPGDTDNDFYMVIGHHCVAAPSAIEQAVGEVREMLSRETLQLTVGAEDIRIVASPSPTLVPAVFDEGLGTTGDRIASIFR